MRRIVRDYVAASIDRAKLELERYIAKHLEYPGPFPYVLIEPVVSIRELRQLKLTPRLRADYPPVDISAAMRVSITASTQRAGTDSGVRTFALDVDLGALGTVQGYGYDVVPHRARLVAWWSE